jgi:hypothetical protein
MRHRKPPPQEPMRMPDVDDSLVIGEGAQVVALANRRSYDVDVALFWARRTGRLWVNVTHHATGRIAHIDATPANALDVFHHPFAHAAY